MICHWNGGSSIVHTASCNLPIAVLNYCSTSSLFLKCTVIISLKNKNHSIISLTKHFMIFLLHLFNSNKIRLCKFLYFIKLSSTCLWLWEGFFKLQGPAAFSSSSSFPVCVTHRILWMGQGKCAWLGVGGHLEWLNGRVHGSRISPGSAFPGLEQGDHMP